MENKRIVVEMIAAYSLLSNNAVLRSKYEW